MVFVLLAPTYKQQNLDTDTVFPGAHCSDYIRQNRFSHNCELIAV